MNEWSFIPWSLQYLLAFIIIISLSYYVLHRSPRNLSSRFFFMFGLFFSLWQILIFLHRNAPSNMMSQYFFALAIFSSLVGGSFLPLTIISIVRYRPYYILFVLPAVMGGLYNVIELPFDMVWNPSYGWSYISRLDHNIIIGASSAIYGVLLIYFALYIWKRYPVLRKKISIIVMTFFIMNAVVMVSANIWLNRHPEAPPFGGIINLLSFIFVTYGILLSPTHTISTKGATHVAESYAAFLEQLYKSIPGKELGSSVVRFRDIIDAMGLKEIVTVDSEGNIIIDSDAFSFDTVGGFVDTVIRGTRVLSLESALLEWIPHIINVSYDEMKKTDPAGARQWGDTLLRDHGAYLNRWGLMKSIQFPEKKPPLLEQLSRKKHYLIESTNPPTLYSSLKDIETWGYDLALITKYSPDHVSTMLGTLPSPVISLRDVHQRAEPSNDSLIGELRQEINHLMKRNEDTILIIDCIDSLIFSEGKDKTLWFLRDLMLFEDISVVGVVNPAIVGEDVENIREAMEGCT